MSSHVETLCSASLEKDESIRVSTKNTFLCFQRGAEITSQYLRNRSFTDSALLGKFIDYPLPLSVTCDASKIIDSEPLSFCETAEGSNSECETDSDSWTSEGPVSQRLSIASATRSGTDIESAIAMPIRQELQSQGCVTLRPEEYTTVMLRNLPNNYTRDMLVELLEAKGFRQRFDFVYVPIDFEKCSGLGYAFVNFLTNYDAHLAMSFLEHFDDWKVPSRKVLHLSWSLPLQGLTANVERYRNSAVMHPDVPHQFKPLLFENGHPVIFPAPTRNITLGVRSAFSDRSQRGAMPKAQPITIMQEDPPISKSRNRQRKSANPDFQSGEYTTVMLRNLPNNYTRDMLVELLESKGFRCRFDFVYLPVDFERASGLGYAFVNFVDHAVAEHAMRILEKFNDWKVPSQKLLHLSWSMPLQGLSANVERYRNNSVMHPDVPEHFKPLVFRDGNPMCFPAPSRNIHPPHRRK